MGGQGKGDLAKGLIETDAGEGQRVKGRRLGSRIAVIAPNAVGTRRVERDQQDGRSLRIRRWV